MKNTHLELLNGITINISYPKDKPIYIECQSKFSDEELENGVSAAVLEEAYILAKLSFQIAIEQLRQNRKVNNENINCI